jgi:hypothetical protein
MIESVRRGLKLPLALGGLADFSNRLACVLFREASGKKEIRL